MAAPADGPGTVTVGAAEAGKRLDAACAALLPGLSLRARRRLIGQGLALVNGRPGEAAYKVRPGQTLELACRPEDGEAYPAGTACPWPGPGLIQAGPDYAVFSKPPGLDSEPLAGKNAPSLAEIAAFLAPDPKFTLLTRLDRETSGLVLAALDPAAAARFRLAEEAGEAAKAYLLLAEGEIGGDFAATFALDTAGRAKTKVLSRDGEPLRYTHVFPLPFAAGPGRTLAAAVIFKGARHQIRAHLAASGHPVAGEALYGHGRPGDRLYLHHARLTLPGRAFEHPPDWPEFQDAMPRIMDALRQVAKMPA
ncbi:MAG: pseudouridine synthase [Desulfovibrionaceae bacterium]|nr:pseudouridine synthase [Desulfovibrionaceae bacterium]MBF0513979.1 pseudouridine synthase [Desulfovibrionaceae bacterium]